MKVICLAFLLALGTAVSAKRFLVVLNPEANSHLAADMIQKTANGVVPSQQGMTLLNHFKLQKDVLTIERELPQVNVLVIDSEEAPQDFFRHNPWVDFVEEEVIYELPKTLGLSAPTSQAVSAKSLNQHVPWGVKAVKAPSVWNQNIRGEGVRVMVLDSGIDQGHPDIRDNFVKGRNFVGRFNVRPNDFQDTIGHGTHVAGTILGSGRGVYGVAPKARLLAGRVCSETGCGSAAIVSGVNWAISERADVVNMSLGGPFASQSERVVYQRANQAGIVIVAATGNRGNGRIDYPARFTSTIAVGAIDSNKQRASFSQYGMGIDLVAPGVDTLSSVPRGTGRTGEVQFQGRVVENRFFEGSAPTQATGEVVDAGLGFPQDFTRRSFRGKIALISRGEISFLDKVRNASQAGAAGVIIYNNAPGLISGTLTNNGQQVVQIPAAMVSQAEGLKWKNRTGVRASVGLVASDYSALAGTSMATPHVSGVIALMKSVERRLGIEQVRSILKETAENLGSQNQLGSGLVDAKAAVAKVRNTRVRFH